MLYVKMGWLTPVRKKKKKMILQISIQGLESKGKYYSPIEKPECFPKPINLSPVKSKGGCRTLPSHKHIRKSIKRNQQGLAYNSSQSKRGG